MRGAFLSGLATGTGKTSPLKFQNATHFELAVGFTADS